MAERYHRARPEYPFELYDDLERLAGLRPSDRLLELGSGTGKATLPLARRGYRITCVELGGELAEAARRNLAPFENVDVVHADFEQWRPCPPGVFDLVFAATSWHWIDPGVRYRRAWEPLRPGGHLAFWSATHVFPDGGDPFFRQIQPLYDALGEGISADAGSPRPGEVPDATAEIEGSGLFDDVAVRQFDWEVVYDAAGYLELLDTFSGHIAMTQEQRDRLYDAIRDRLAARSDGRVHRHWGVALHVARRVG